MKEINHNGLGGNNLLGGDTSIWQRILDWQHRRDNMGSRKSLPQPTQIEKMRQAQKAKPVSMFVADRLKVDPEFKRIEPTPGGYVEVTPGRVVEWTHANGWGKGYNIGPITFDEGGDWNLQDTMNTLGLAEPEDKRTEGEKWADEWTSKQG